MNSGRSWLVYSLIRVGLFVAVLLLLLLIGLEWYFAAIAAALISLSLSIIFLRKPREEAAASLYRARQSRTEQASPVREGVDEDFEDAAVDGSERDRER